MNLNQLTLPSVDLLRAIPFYEQLGLRLIVDSRPRYARFVCPDGNTSVSLHRVDALPQGPGIRVYFECEQLDETVAELEAQGISFLTPPTDQAWLWREAHLLDPDGNYLILYRAGENRLNPPWRINPDQ
jgi:predicted enzyme related to lactoylglutathione lyase